jgi:signal transduction histidine kinase
MSECEIEKDGEYVGRYECATHGVWYCDSDRKPKASCPVGEAEEGLRREMAQLHAEIFRLKPMAYQVEELQAELRQIREAVAEGAPHLFLPEAR